MAKRVNNDSSEVEILDTDGTTIKKSGGGNARSLTFGIEAMRLAKEPLDFQDAEAVDDRILQYLYLCQEHNMRPMITSLALALGTDRRRLWEIRTGTKSTYTFVANLPKETKDTIKRIYDLVEFSMDYAAQNGDIHPIYAIFSLSNNHGYKRDADLSEAFVDREQQRPQLGDIASRYKALGAGESSDFSNSDGEIDSNSSDFSNSGAET